MAWTLAGSAFFLSLSSRRVDERLLLAGYRRSELAAGRLLFLAAIAMPAIAIYSTLITTLSRGDNLTVVLAIASTGAIAVGVGLSLAAIVPRELEELLALIAIIGVQTSIPTDAAITPALPFYGPTQLIVIAWDSTGDLLPPLLHSAATITVLLAIFLTMWGRGLMSSGSEPLDHCHAPRPPSCTRAPRTRSPLARRVGRGQGATPSGHQHDLPLTRPTRAPHRRPSDLSRQQTDQSPSFCTPSHETGRRSSTSA